MNQASGQGFWTSGPVHPAACGARKPSDPTFVRGSPFPLIEKTRVATGRPVRDLSLCTNGGLDRVRNISGKM